jgi:hypothetical protein
LKYCNDHTIKNFKGRTPYIESSPISEKGSKDATPKSKQIQNGNQDFSSAIMEFQSD